MSEEEQIKELLKIEKERRELAENLISTLEMIIKNNVPEKLGKCFYLIKPVDSFRLAFTNSPNSFAEFPDCFDGQLSDEEKYNRYKTRKPFIKAICKHCRN
jgi:hypothetical protein